MTSNPTVASEIESAFSGARFFRADLHIHTFGASHDVRDTLFTPEAVISQAVKERLAIVAITDHNEIGNVAAAIAAGKRQGVLVVAGVELSTPQGHLLAYFPDLKSLQLFYGKLDLADRGTNQSRSNTGILDCLKIAEACGGFCVLAHVDGDGGLETVVPGYPPHKSDLICHSALLGLELRNAQSTVSYSAIDPDADRASIGQKRIVSLKLGARLVSAFIPRTGSISIRQLPAL
jgi:hypothetical protein